MVRKPTQVTENVSSALRDYELVMIVTPEGGEEALEAAVERVSEQITAGGGEVGTVDRWGKKKLAYPIEHHLEGSYALFTCKLKPEQARGLESSLDIAEDVIRHLLVALQA